MIELRRERLIGACRILGTDEMRQPLTIDARPGGVPAVAALLGN